MMLRKYVEVETTQADVIDYLRARIGFTNYRTGDAVEVRKAPAEDGVFYSTTSTPAVGTVCVITWLSETGGVKLAGIAYATNKGEICKTSIPQDCLRLINRAPHDWKPSELAVEISAADPVAEMPDDEVAVFPEPRVSPWASHVKDVADRAEARSRGETV